MFGALLSAGVYIVVTVFTAGANIEECMMSCLSGLFLRMSFVEWLDE